MTRLKQIRKRWRKIRNGWAARFFETRYGRELLVNALPGRVLSMTTDCGDHVLTFSPHDYIGRKVYRKGHFERPQIGRLTATLREEGVLRAGSVLLEIGGNIGTQTIYWARTGIFRHILSIEADPRNFALLTKNIADNGLSHQVTLVQAAAGETEGMIDFFQNPDNHGKSAARRTSARDRQIRVPVRSVSAILAEAGVAPQEVGLIWMDIEGYEPVACRSMHALLQGGTPLYMEFSPGFYGSEAGAFRDLLATHYGRAVVFSDDHPVRRMEVKDLPLDEAQYDVLLLR
jgi:FkbM family methyltransferase